MSRLVIAAGISALVSGCVASIPDGRFGCDVSADCPPGQSCVGGVCRIGAVTDGGADAGVDGGSGDAGRPPDGGARDGGRPVDGGDAAVVGDGGDCTPGCDPGTCDRSVAPPRCDCPSGYEDPPGADAVCRDIDECAGPVCDANATCTNTPGSYTCACNCGYSGDGATCALSTMSWGPASPLPMTSSNSRDYLLGSRITVDAPARLLNFGIYSRSSGAQIRVALYRDAAGSPGELVQQSQVIDLVAGEIRGSPQSPCVTIAAGTYWLLSVGNIDFGLGSDGATSVDTIYVAHNYSTALPSTFPAAAASRFGGPNINVYLITD